MSEQQPPEFRNKRGTQKDDEREHKRPGASQSFKQDS